MSEHEKPRTALGAYFADLREGVRILSGRAFWRDFRAYWSADAVAQRIAEWDRGNRRALGKPRDMVSYDIGYRDGESNAHADWFIALEGVLPDDVDPDDVTPPYVRALLEERERGQ